MTPLCFSETNLFIPDDQVVDDFDADEVSCFDHLAGEEDVLGGRGRVAGGVLWKMTTETAPSASARRRTSRVETVVEFHRADVDFAFADRPRLRIEEDGAEPFLRVVPVAGYEARARGLTDRARVAVAVRVRGETAPELERRGETAPLSRRRRRARVSRGSSPRRDNAREAVRRAARAARSIALAPAVPEPSRSATKLASESVCGPWRKRRSRGALVGRKLRDRQRHASILPTSASTIGPRSPRSPRIGATPRRRR